MRMISSISKWDGSKVINRKDTFICGDAISDLRTRDNKLSVWKADTEEDINDAIVALALSRMKVEKLAYCLLEEGELERIEISISNEKIGEAEGLEEQIRTKHRDLIDIDYWRIGFLAEYMMALTKDTTRRRECSNKEVKNLLEKYKNTKKINPEQVKEALKKNLNW